MRVGASQNLAGQGDSIFQDHLVADTAATDIIELLDAKLLDELARDRLPLGVGNRGRRNRMVEDDDDFVGVRNPLRHGRGRGKRQVDLNDLIDIANHDIAGSDPAAAAVPRENLLGHRHAHIRPPAANDSVLVTGVLLAQRVHLIDAEQIDQLTERIILRNRFQGASLLELAQGIARGLIVVEQGSRIDGQLEPVTGEFRDRQ